jgi:hypothetical protein
MKQTICGVEVPQRIEASASSVGITEQTVSSASVRDRAKERLEGLVQIANSATILIATGLTLPHEVLRLFG